MRKLNHTLPPYAPTEFRDRVGRAAGRVQQGQIKRQSAFPDTGQKRRKIHVYRDPGVGVGHVTEIVKLCPTGVMLHVQKAMFHSVSFVKRPPDTPGASLITP
ncbi:hypothetical protein SDC9_83984 [bioreactor metagenome]|uniref:Uncharacterized protein n=1 Tax=bioreactor metagenome TaxID=1076179 RepID=A0A644ZF88_9ZZZZ